MASLRSLSRPGFGLIGLTVTTIGAGVLLVAFVLLDWFVGNEPNAVPSSDGIAPVTTLTFRDAYVAGTQDHLRVLTHDYVTWLGWALLFAAVLAAVVSSLPGARSNRWRVAGVIIGVGAAAVTYLACTFTVDGDPANRLSADIRAGFGDTKLGAKLALAGFLICALGAALGPFGARTGAAVSPDGRPWSRRRVGSVTALVAACVLLVLAFDFTDWYHQESSYDDRPSTSFDDLINLLGGRGASRLATAYFPTLAWLLLVAAVAVVVFANLRTALSSVMRAAGVLIGIVGVVLTYLAISRLFDVTSNPAGGHSVFHSTRSGPWLAFAGYLLCAVAAALSPPAPALSEESVAPSSDAPAHTGI